MPPFILLPIFTVIFNCIGVGVMQSFYRDNANGIRPAIMLWAVRTKANRVLMLIPPFGLITCALSITRGFILLAYLLAKDFLNGR